jgi:hypothetical protein
MFPKRRVFFTRAGVCAAIAVLTLAAGATALAQNAGARAAAVPPQSAATGRTPPPRAIRKGRSRTRARDASRADEVSQQGHRQKSQRL